jgi:predicted metallopeptidase
MIIELGKYAVKVEVVAESEETSRHSGKQLRILDVRFPVRGKSANDEVLDLISGARGNGITSASDDGSKSSWKVVNSSYSYQDGSPVFWHTLTLKEMEDLKVEYLLLDSLRLEPYYYMEEFDEDRLVVAAKVKVTEEQHKTLASLHTATEALTLLRPGVTEESTQVSLVADNWSRQDEFYKHYLRLEEKRSPESKRPFPVLAHVGASIDESAISSATINALIRVLIEKGVLSPEETEKVIAEGKKSASEVHYQFYQVDDIDAFDVH